MDREVFRASLREIHTRFTADKLTRKDGDTRKYSRDSGCFQDRQGAIRSLERDAFVSTRKEKRTKIALNKALYFSWLLQTLDILKH